MENQLHQAVQAQQFQTVISLIVNGADLNARDDNGNTPLYLAVRSQNEQILDVLLQVQANVNVITGLNKYSLLHTAVELKNESISKMLLKAGADVNAKSDYMDTPLHKAVEFKSLNISKLLLNAGADVNSKNLSGKTPLHVAVKSADLNILKLLLEAGADLEAKDTSEETPLFMAVKVMNENILDHLLKSGASVNIESVCGLTPLHVLLQQKYINEKALKLLLEAGADLSAKSLRDVRPIHYAAGSGNLNILKMTLEYGADSNSKSNLGLTPLHIAAKCNKFNFDVLNHLLVHGGADVNEKDASGNNTAFSLFIKYHWKHNENENSRNFIESLKLLIEGVDVNLIDTKGEYIIGKVSKSCNNAKNGELEFVQKTIIKHIAKLKLLNINVDSKLTNFLLNINSNFRKYFVDCMNELETAKNTKLRPRWVTFFELLVANRLKLVRYGGNQDLINAFRENVGNFSIYGDEAESKVSKGIDGRTLYDDAAKTLSVCFPIFNSTHLIVTGILDVLNEEDWKKLNEKS